MLVIGLTGKKRSGKDETCKTIEAWGLIHHYPVARRAFADKLKLSFYRQFYPKCTQEEVLYYADMDREDTELLLDHPMSSIAVSVRQAWQNYGVEGHREILGEDIWLDQVLPPSGIKDDLYDWYPGLSILVITDVRMENEAIRIKELGGEIWKLDRPETEVEDEHVSEAGVPDEYIDTVLHNEGTLDDLREMVLSHISPRFYTWQ